MVSYERISIRTERAGDGLVKVVWSDSNGAPFPPYRLRTSWLNEKARRVRSALEQLREAYLHVRPDFSGATAGLIERGQELRVALFDDCLPEDRNAADEPRAWFEEHSRSSANIVITVHADPIMPLPWGLLYEQQVVDEAGFCEGFWALRFQVAAIYSGMAPQRLRRARLGQDVKLLSGINQQVFESTHRALDTQAQKDYIETFLDRQVGRAFTSRGCQDRWRQVGNSDCVIHFFCHATGSELRLDDTDRLTASSFRALFRRESRVERPGAEPTYVLSFLNGCASVAGVDSESFLIATADPGFCGFIGAEAKVPDRFALLFGQELLYNLMVQGMSVRRSMLELWRKHRPMALLYGCYAQPDFAITQDPEYPQLPLGFEQSNFHPEPRS